MGGSMWLLLRLLCASRFGIAALVESKSGGEMLGDKVREGLGNGTFEEQVELAFAFEDARGRGDVNVNVHANANVDGFANLFRRAGCSLYEAGKTYTCVDSSNLCCNVGDYGWCCANTVACGTTSGQCRFDVEWTTSTYWTTTYSTDYSEYTSTLYSTFHVTSTSYSYTTITADLDTATKWVTVTSEALRAGRRGVPAEPTTSIALSTSIVPSQVSLLPSATPASNRLQRPELRDPKTTAAPLYIQIRGLILPRQGRTDTSETIVTETTTITRTDASTTFSTSTVSDIEWTTSYGTRTAALNARTTVTSTTTLGLQPGETGFSDAHENGDSAGGGSGSTSRRKGLSSAARAGIGVGVALVIAGIAAIIGFFVKKRKNEKIPAASEVGSATATGLPPMVLSQSQTSPPFHPQGSPMTLSDQRHSHMTPTPPISYGTPSPIYGYQQQQNMPIALSPPQQYQQPYVAYQYPRPPSPTLGPRTELAGGNTHQRVASGMPSEMPAVYSPHPQRLP